MSNNQQIAVDAVRSWRDDPVKFVRDVLSANPDAWQIDVLRAAATDQRIAMQACKGPGKSCVLAWLIWWWMLTRPHPKVAVTSISADNLSDGLWAELAKWQHKSELLKSQFTWTKTRLYCNAAPETWFCSARSWSKSADKDQQANTLAGLHADYLMFVLDEVGDQPDAVMAAAEAGLASGIQSRLIIAGNPTNCDGPLWRAANKESDLWTRFEITGDPDDPKRSPRVSAQWAREQITKYGRDNPWVLVNVFGKFPPGSLSSLLAIAECREAAKRQHAANVYYHSAKIIGVDVAFEGDDSTVITKRQGLKVWPQLVLRNSDSIQIAREITAIYDSWGADGVLVDNTGGFGAGVFHQLRSWRYDVTPVHFSSKSSIQGYKNKRAEMHWLGTQWVKDGGQLPDDAELHEELCASRYWRQGDLIQIEPKDQVKDRIGRSPDKGDSFYITFAYPIRPKAEAEEQFYHDQYDETRSIVGGY